MRDKLINLIYPLRCAVCDDVVPVGEGLICNDCKIRPKYIREPRCRKCGRGLDDDSKIYCNDCRTKKHMYNYGYSLYDYNSMKMSIYRFKYMGRCEYSKFYAADLCEKLGGEIQRMNADALIPVPIHKTRQRERGYNQAEELSVQISRLTGIPVYKDIIKRVKATIPQKELNPRERQNNLKKAFNIGQDVVKLNKTIIVDDIYTTGSTIDAVAVELRNIGVKEVYFLTLCIGEGI
jgi:ComF family protein